MIQLEPKHVPDPDDDSEEKELPLLDRDVFPVVLTAGEFVAAEGFEIAKGGKIALPLEYDGDEIAEMLEAGVLIYSLTWSAKTSP